jgi:hypothetical protein
LEILFWKICFTNYFAAVLDKCKTEDFVFEFLFEKFFFDVFQAFQINLKKNGLPKKPTGYCCNIIASNLE